MTHLIWDYRTNDWRENGLKDDHAANVQVQVLGVTKTFYLKRAPGCGIWATEEIHPWQYSPYFFGLSSVNDYIPLGHVMTTPPDNFNPSTTFVALSISK